MNSFSWDFIKSLGLKYYSLQDKNLIPGNKVCSALTKLQFLMDSEECPSESDKFICTSVGCNTALESICEMEAHMKARHTFYCSSCSLVLPSHHLLDRHLLEVHDSFFHVLSEKQPMYACLLESCNCIFQNEAYRKEHCLKKHNFPNDFRFDLKWRKLPTQKPRNRKFSSHKKKVHGSDTTPDEPMTDECPPDEMDFVVTEDFQQCLSSRTPDRPNKSNNNVKLKVPLNISFGIGVPRTFNRSHSYKNKFWHQKERSYKTKTKIEHISLKDLNDALDDVNPDKVETMEDIKTES